MRLGLDAISFGVYTAIGLLMVFFIWKGEKHSYIVNNRKKYSVIGKLCYFIAFIVPVFLFTFREISEGYGGSDVPSYLSMFHEATFDDLNIEHFLGSSGEPIFTLFNCILSQITNNDHIYLFCVLAIITGAYLYFCSHFYSYEADLFITIFLGVPTYVYFFSAIRNGLAVAFALIAFVKLKEDKKCAMLFWVMMSIGFHYSAVIIVPFIIFYYLFRKGFSGIVKSVIVLGGVVVLEALSLQALVLVLSHTRYSFLIHGGGGSFFGQIPKIALVILCFLEGQRYNSKKTEYLVGFAGAAVNVIIIPVVYILNIYRWPYFFILLSGVALSGVVKHLDINLTSISSRRRMEFMFGCIVILYSLYRLNSMAVVNAFLYRFSW